MTHRDQLIARIVAENDGPGEAVVSLEEFFTGNADPGSIGCNLGEEQPPIAVFYSTLRAIRNRSDVQDVLIRICDYAASDATSWPFSDTVYILTSARLEDVRQWVAPLKPDEIYAEWMYGTPPKAPSLGRGIVPYSVWWD